MTKPKENPPLEGNDACVLMHTALRKACDSKITSAAYNLIHTIHIEPEKWDPWRMLGALVAKELNAGKKPVPALESAIARLDNVFMDQVVAYRDKEMVPDDARSMMYALKCTLECFAASDVRGMASYLEEG
jgi:hypothetical protein